MNLTKTLAAIAAAAALILTTGCAKNATKADSYDYKDGNAGLVASELNDMGAVEQPQAASGKAFLADAVPGEVIINPFTYYADCGGFVRKSTRTFADTNDVRTRTDTVYFFAAGVKLDSATKILGVVDSIYHIRNVERTRNGNLVNIRLAMRINVSRSASDTVAVKNGTISGTYNGFEFRSATVTNVTRHRVDGRWGFPVSGSIHIDRLLRTIDILFTGNGGATATITRNSDGKEWIITIDAVNAVETD